MKISKSLVSYTDTRQFSSLFLDYAHDKLPQFASVPVNLEGIASLRTSYNDKNVDRKLLAEVLQQQYKRDGISCPRIADLENASCYTVCTGHQLCLFTGPLYFIYKIISTIKLARQLKEKYPENDFVPVYWMASEDHDFDEIASIYLFGKNCTWTTNAGGAVGRMTTDGMVELLAELRTLMGESIHAGYLHQLFSDCYLDAPNLASATRKLVHRLFGHYGLIVLDADNKQLKEKAYPLFQNDLLNRSNFKLVNEQIERLKAAGYSAQVNPREINLFRLGTNERTRILPEDLDSMQLSPDVLSPNVVLRPLYQQLILPNLAYVGGPGELAYWLEYKTMFEYHQLVLPALVPRNFALLMDEKQNSQLRKWKLKDEDVFLPVDVLIKNYLESLNEGFGTEEEEQKISAVYKELKQKIAALEPTLAASVEAELQKTISGLNQLKGKVMKAEKQKHDIGVQQIRKMKERMFPEGVLQERKENFIPYYLKYGPDFIEGLMDTFDPLEKQFYILTLQQEGAGA